MLIRDMVVGRTMERLLRRLRSTRLMRGNMFHREENMMRDGTRREMGGGREVRVSMRRLDIIVLLLKRASPMVHRNMSNLLRRLDTNLLRVASTADRLLQEGINLLEDIRDTKPLSGLGYFQISRPNLISMLSLTFTYLIILLQFRLS